MRIVMFIVLSQRTTLIINVPLCVRTHSPYGRWRDFQRAKDKIIIVNKTVTSYNQVA